MTTKKAVAPKKAPAKTATKSVVAPASTLTEEANAVAPRNTKTFAPAEPSVLTQRMQADTAALQSMQTDSTAAAREDILASLQEDAVRDTTETTGNLSAGHTEASQAIPGVDPALAAALVQALANGVPAAAPQPAAPVYSPKLVTPGVVQFLHVLKDIDVAEFDQKLDDLFILLQARAQSRTENARRLQTMTLAMHIYQEFDFLWPKGSQVAPHQ